MTPGKTGRQIVWVIRSILRQSREPYFWTLELASDAGEVTVSVPQFLRLQKWMKHGLEDGLLVPLIGQDIHILQKTLLPKKRS